MFAYNRLKFQLQLDSNDPLKPPVDRRFDWPLPPVSTIWGLRKRISAGFDGFRVLTIIFNFENSIREFYCARARIVQSRPTRNVRGYEVRQ